MKIIESYTDKLIINDIINSEDRQLYTYGLYQGLLIALNILTTIIIGFFFGMIWQSIVYLVIYIPLRSYAGGFHAKTKLRCYLYSIILIVVVLVAIKFIAWTIPLIAILAFLSGTTIFLLAPVEDKNKPLDSDEVIVYKRRARIILLLELAVILILMLIGLKVAAAVCVVSLCLLSVMLFVGELKNDLLAMKIARK